MEAHRTQEIFVQGSSISNLLFEEREIHKGFIPQSLIRLCDASLNSIAGKTIDSCSEMTEDDVATPRERDEPVIELQTTPRPPVIHLMPSPQPVRVAAIDVSSIRLGETEEGGLCALRGGMVWRDTQRYHYLRFGPLIFHISEELSKSFSAQPSPPLLLYNIQFPVNHRAIIRLRNILERGIQKAACASFGNTLLLMDGSLTSGTPDNPTAPLQQILELAHQSNNIVIGISKSTKLVMQGRNVTEMLNGHHDPCLIDLDREVKSRFQPFPIKLVGRVYVAKLSADGFGFRLDIDNTLSKSQGIQAIQSLMGSDIMEQGYPETLRLAHILSSFTHNEILGIQRFLSCQYNIQISHKVNIRRSLFGPYSTNMEGT